jgi:glutamine amidotransferase
MKEKVYVVNHGVGNTVAILNLLEKMGFSPVRINSGEEIAEIKESGAHLILPGVGSFAAGMNSLNEKGLTQPLLDHASSGGHIMGICLGMQLLCESSEEGSIPGLGIIPGNLVRMQSFGNHRVPHVGWEKIQVTTPDPIFEGLSKFRFYHNHSFSLLSPSPHELASINYSNRYSVVIRKDNVIGVQFHPEKSHVEGKRIFMNFLNQ